MGAILYTILLARITEHHNEGDQEAIDIMLKVLEIIKKAFPSDTIDSNISLIRTKFGLSSFMRTIELNK